MIIDTTHKEHYHTSSCTTVTQLLHQSRGCEQLIISYNIMNTEDELLEHKA